MAAPRGALVDRRSLAMLAAGVLVVAVIALLGVRAWSSARLERVGSLLGELAACLVGPDRPEPSDAEVVARRWLAHNRRRPKVCVPQAEAFSQAKAVLGIAPAAHARAEDLVSALQADKVDASIGAFFEAAAPLPWRVPPSPPGAPLEQPIIDRDLPALRAAWPALVVVREDEPGAVLFARDAKSALQIGDGTGGSLSGVRASTWPDPRRGLDATARDEHGFGRVRGDGGGEVDLGPATQASAVGSWVLLVRGNAIVAQRHLGGLRFGPPSSIPLPFTPKRSIAFVGCPHPRGLVITVSSVEEAYVGMILATTDTASAWPWLKIEPANDGGLVGVVRPTCHPGGARAAWSVSEPNVKSAPLGVPLAPIPTEPQPVRVETFRCEIAGPCSDAACATRTPCEHRLQRVSSLDLGWQGMGGYGASFSLVAPDVVDLGRSVALLWSGWKGLQLRVAPLEALPSAPTRTIVEVVHPAERGERAARESRAIGHHDERLSAWDDALLVAVQEREPDYASLVVRVDAAGDVRALRP